MSRKNPPNEFWGEVQYPDSDGLPVGNNEPHLAWIRFVMEALERHFRGREEIGIFGDLFWYPVQGRPDICVAPDVMVVFGRGNARRGSYRQWEEGVVPQVIFEILSPVNSVSEMLKKHRFFDQYGAEEYYVYDCIEHALFGYSRRDGQLLPVDSMTEWISPRLGIGMELDLQGNLRLFTPDGRVLRGFRNTMDDLDEERAEKEKERAAKEHERAEKERLAAMLRELGVDPDNR